MTEAQGRVGRWLRNKWHLDSLIAIGGMAAVYSSTHRNGARAAIKMLHSQYTRNEQARRRFLAEGYAANKVGHRNAVLVLDDDATEDGEVYLVMELLDGESLEGRLERVGVMSPMEVLALTDQLLEVLACAHPKGILHRDIKPANIYLTRDGAVKLLDFGLARVRELSAEAMDQSDGIVFGTVSYIAPEQARADNQNLDARSDMWSIAATMFRALSGETVHPSTGPVIDRLMAVARKPPRSIASVVPHLPRQVIELVDRALAFDPENRWPSANVMRVVVQDVMAQLREEAEAQGEDDEMTGMFSRPPLGPSPMARHKTGGELPAVRTGPSTPLGEDPQPRPKTDPVALSVRPRSLPSRDPEVDVEVDLETAVHADPKGRRSRTLLTKEGRAELRRILDARKAAADGKPVEEPTPRPVRAEVSAAESMTGEIDVEVDDSIIEVTIDHTHKSRPGPIAEALADNTTPAPVRADRVTGGFAAVPPAPVPEDRRPPSQTSARSGLEDSRSRREVAGVMEDSRSRRGGGASRSTSATVPEDRRTASTASYPTLGGATSRPIQPPARAPEAPRASARQEEITRVAPAPTEPAKGPPPISGEIGARGPAEITRVGPPPAPPSASATRAVPPRPSEGARPAGTLHDTLRPATIPPVSRPGAGGRPTPVEGTRLAPPPDKATKAEPTPQPARTESPTPVPAKTEAVRVETRPPARAEATPVQAKHEPVSEVTPPPLKVDVPVEAPPPEAPKSAPARAGVFAAPPSRAGGPVSRGLGAGPVEPMPQRGAPSSSEPGRGPAQGPGLPGLPSRGAAKPASGPTRAAISPLAARSPIGPASTPATPAGAPAATPAAAPATAVPATQTPAGVATATPTATPAAATQTTPAAPSPATQAPTSAATPSVTPTPAARPAQARAAGPAAPRPAAAPAAPTTAARATPQPAEPVAEPDPKDSESEAAARAAAPTAANPVVPAEEPVSREPKLKAGAPVLPFSFLRSGPATRPGEAPSEPPRGDGTPPRKKP